MAKKTQKKIRNWSEYNKGLVNRGQRLFTFDEDYRQQLYYTDKQERGGVKRYTPFMYEFLLTIKVRLRFPWRATLGFAQGLLDTLFPEQTVCLPHDAHASRVTEQLRLIVKPRDLPLNEGVELAFDSREHYKRAIQIAQTTLGNNHSRLAIYLSNLAGIYRLEGQVGQAKTLLEQALAIDTQVLGVTHPTTQVML